jgi:hypothetical protein
MTYFNQHIAPHLSAVAQLTIAFWLAICVVVGLVMGVYFLMLEAVQRRGGRR